MRREPRQRYRRSAIRSVTEGLTDQASCIARTAAQFDGLAWEQMGLVEELKV